MDNIWEKLDYMQTTGLLYSLREDSREYQHEVLPSIVRSYRYEQSKSQYSYSKPYLVHNKRLEEQFHERKREFRQAGYSDKEIKESYGFLYISEEQNIELICGDGLKVGNLKSSCLGHADMEVELGKSEELLTREVSDFDLESQIRKVNKSYRRLDEFGPKFEETLERLSLTLETAKAEEDLKTFQKESELYFNIITEVTSREEELKLIDNFLQEKYKNLSKPEPDSKIEQLIEIQMQMMQQMQLQNAKPQHDEQNQAAVKLPKVEIMGYNGDKQKNFGTNLNKLHGTAQSAISGLQLSNENYDVAIDILKDRFGDIQNAVNAHYVELINLSCASNRTSELRFLFDKIERNLRSLEALNQNIDQDDLFSMITTKLPGAVLVQLEIQKGSNKWTVEKLRDLLKSYIAAREAAESQSKEKTNDVKPQQPSNANVQSRYKPSYGKPQNVRSSGEALFSATDDRPFPPNRTKVKKLCIYCKGSHWSDECSMYKTIEDRKAQLNGLCYICLKSGHRYVIVLVTVNVYIVVKRKKHHRSLCLKKFATNRTEISNLADEAVETTESVSLTTESSFLSSGDIVLMQTAKTVITNMSDTCNEEIRLLLDSEVNAHMFLKH
ncbi:unnamed protein product [Mytilus coruscus]|uniref:Uncharacterized protein n=1 Tax=Mytilus coruscus TaxID=42192 RepID=A0A6J8DZ58_MYTCO|nr:unnamed protein product [Mytilus coruscus]